MRWLAPVLLSAAACGNAAPDTTTFVTEGALTLNAPSLPRAPGAFGPSLVAISRDQKVDGVELADVDTCATCHPSAWQQWSQSAHSFASFGNPIYRANIELFRGMLGKKNSQHCGGCHDMPLVVDGTMLADIPADDIRAHNGVTCRLCHGVDKVTLDGNGSYVLDAEPLPIPTPGDQASIDVHKQAVTLKPLGTDVCMGCHRGFLSPDMDLPIHMSGIDEPGVWRGSAWNGNGTGRIDKVEKKNCLDCHMQREAAVADEVAADDNGTIVSHRFAGGHTWMASMRDDADQLAVLQRNLVGAASIDIAGVRDHTRAGDTWYLPADGAPVTPGAHLDLDVVIRNLSVGHRFPGGVNDMQDTWLEVEVVDAAGAPLAQSGLAHRTDPTDLEAHVLRALPVDDDAQILDEHEMPKFRSVIAIHTLAPREAQVIRYALEVPKDLGAARLPLTVTARMRHRSRSLHEQDVVCRESKTPEGTKFLRGVEDTRYVLLDPCAPQPITEIAETVVLIGSSTSTSTSTRPAWERMYEHGMALTAVIGERLDEAKIVLERALEQVPPCDGGAGASGPSTGRAAPPRGAACDGAARAKAMIEVQLALVAGKQGRTDDAMALLDDVETLIPGPVPPVVPTVRADALARVWRWEDALAPAKLATERAPQNTAGWVMYARVLASLGDDHAALEATREGLVYTPRDPDLLRTQAVCLNALGSDLADDALAAFDRFRQPDATAELRIECARKSLRCEREREMGHTHPLTLVR